MTEFLRIWIRRVIPVLLLALIGLLAWGNLSFVERAPAQTPFVPRWTGLRAWLAEGRSPYDSEVSLDAQTRIYGRPANLERGEDPQHFLYPPLVALVLGPFALLSLPLARALWMTTLQVCLLILPIVSGVALRWPMTGWPRFGGSILSLVSLAGVLAVLQGEVGVVVLILVLLSLAALLHRQEALAGLAAAATVVKPHLAVLYVLYLYVWGIKNRRWNLLGWLTTGLALLVGVSTALLPTWPLDMARQAIDYAELSIARSVMSRILGSGSEPYSALVLIASAAALGYLFWEWRLSLAGSERSMIWVVMLTLVMTSLLAPFATLANHILLIPPLLLTAGVLHEKLGQGREIQMGFLLAALGLLSWLAAGEAMDPSGPASIVLILPPLLVLLALGWIRWWATRPPLILEAARHQPAE